MTSNSHGRAHEAEGRGVDVQAVDVDVGTGGRPFQEEAAEKGHRRQDVGFVDAGNARAAAGAAAPLGQRERGIEQPVAAALRNAHRIEHGIAVAPALVARREEPLGRFANDHEVDCLRPRVGQGRLNAGYRADGAQARVELKMIAKIDLGTTSVPFG